LDNSTHNTIASIPTAGLAVAVIDVEAMLKIAQRPIRLAVIAQGRAAGINCLGNDLADVGYQRLKAGSRKAACGYQGSGTTTW